LAAGSVMFYVMNSNSNGRRVAVTGMGFITPIGNDEETVWSNLVEGVSGVGLITHFDTNGFDTKIAGEVKGFNPEDWMDRKTARHIGRYCQFALAASKQALAAAGLDPAQMDPDDVGVIVSSGIGGMEEIEKSHTQLMERGPKRISPFTVPMMIADMAAADHGRVLPDQGDQRAQRRAREGMPTVRSRP